MLISTHVCERKPNERWNELNGIGMKKNHCNVQNAFRFVVLCCSLQYVHEEREHCALIKPNEKYA